MGGYQVKHCDNCSDSELDVIDYPCCVCNNFSEWQTNRGRTKGTKSKPGSKKTGPKTKPSEELMCFPTIPIRAKDLEAYGGIETLKADVKIMINDKIK